MSRQCRKPGRKRLFSDEGEDSSIQTNQNEGFEMTEQHGAEMRPFAEEADKQEEDKQEKNNGGVNFRVVETELLNAITTDNLGDVEKIMNSLNKEWTHLVFTESKAILEAVACSSWDCLEFLLAFRCPTFSDETDGRNDITDRIISEDKDGNNIFHYLAKQSEEGIRIIKQSNFKSVEKIVDRPNKNGITPLMMSLDKRNTALATFLVTQNASFDKDNHGQSPIKSAVMSGQDEVLEEMLNKKRDSLTIISKNEKLFGKGHTIFYPAAFSGNDKVFMCLTEKLGEEKRDEFLRQELKHETDSKTFVKHMTSTGMTKFMEALMELVKKLDIELDRMTDELERTPLMWAVEGNHKPMVELLLKSESTPLLIMARVDKTRRNIFHHAAAVKDSKTLEYLIVKHQQLAEKESGPLYNSRGRHRCPPLHWAAAADSYENVDLLLKHNVETIEQSIFLCPEHVKCTKDKMLKHILEEIEKQNEENFSTFHESKNHNNWSPTHVAAWAGKTKILEELLKKGADPESLSKFFNWSILHFAVTGKSLPTVQFLIKKYPQMVNWKSTDDKTAAVLAAENGSSEILEQILKNGGKVFGDCPKENLFDCVTSREAQQYTPIQNRKKNALKIIEFCQSNGGVDRLKQLMNDCLGGRAEIMCKLLEQMPSVALEVLNQCQEKVESEDFKITAQRYHFFALQKQEKGDETLLPIETMIKYECYDCLSHPVVVKFLDKKWEGSPARKWYFLNIILYAVFLILMTTYTALQTHGSCKFPCSIYFFLVCIVMIFFKEIMQMVLSRDKYFLHINNYLEWMIYISAGIYILPLGNEKTKTQIQAGAIAVFMAWIYFIWFSKRLSPFCIYIIMAKKVFVSLLKESENVGDIVSNLAQPHIVVFGSVLEYAKLFITIKGKEFCTITNNCCSDAILALLVLPMVLLFIFAFAMVFFMLMSNKDDGFKSIPVSMITTSVMMAGEINYREEFLGEEEDPHVYLERTLLICFLVIMTIVVMNLFTGLAVGDTNETMKRSKAEKLLYDASLLVTLQRTSLSLPWVKLKEVDDPLTVDVKVEEKKSVLVWLWDQIYFDNEVDDEDEKLHQISSRIGEVEKSISVVKKSISVVEESVSQVQESMACMKTLLEKMTIKMDLTDDNTNPSMNTDTNVDTNTGDSVNDKIGQVNE